MYLAKATDERRIEATKEESGFCPRCKDQLTAKLGEIYTWHWSHKPGKACDYRKGTSVWQYQWFKHYHGLDDWEVETNHGGFEFDGINKAKQWSLMLASKFDFVELVGFVKASKRLKLKPVVIFNAGVFERFNFNFSRFRSKRASDQTWVFFSSNTSDAGVPEVSAWLDVEKGSVPDYGMESGLYQLSYNDGFYQEIVLNPNPKQRRRINLPIGKAD